MNFYSRNTTELR